MEEDIYSSNVACGLVWNQSTIIHGLTCAEKFFLSQSVAYTYEELCSVPHPKK